MLKPADIAVLLIQLDDYLHSGEVTNLGLNEALGQLIALNELKKDISLIYEAYASMMIEKMQAENSTIVNLPSGIEVKCLTSAPRKKWDNENLLSVVYDRIEQSSTDMDTGEVGLSSREIVIKLLDYLSPSYWRVKQLNEIGINADMYCETSESKTNIAIFGANQGRNK